MTEPFEGAEEAPSGQTRPAAAAPTTAGGMIRAARERQGLHIAALATAIKVSPRKLDALENDRYDELPDATFTRALAQTVCKTLKLPAAPVLALLPAADASALDHVTGALNEPFRERPGREEHAALAAVAVRPMVWMGVALLLAALVLFLAPASWWQRLASPGVVADAASAPSAASAAASGPAVVPAVAAVPASEASAPSALASAPAAASEPVSAAPLPAVGNTPAPPVAVAGPQAAPTPAPAPTATPATSGQPMPGNPAAGLVRQSAPAAVPAPVAAANPAATAAVPPPAPAGAAALQLQADQATWAEVRDARGQVLVSRLVRAGEVVQMAGTPPLKLTLGNAPGARLSFRGKPVDLVPFTRDSVARFELQ